MIAKSRKNNGSVDFGHHLSGASAFDAEHRSFRAHEIVDSRPLAQGLWIGSELELDCRSGLAGNLLRFSVRSHRDGRLDQRRRVVPDCVCDFLCGAENICQISKAIAAQRLCFVPTAMNSVSTPATALCKSPVNLIRPAS